MITTLSGENAFGLRHALRQAIAQFVAAYGDLALEQFDGEETEAPVVAGALTALPFLAARKLVVLRGFATNKQFVETAAELLANVPETTDVLVVEPKLDKRSSYYKWLKAHTDFQEFAMLDERALAAWAVEYAASRGATLGRSDASWLIARVGDNQQRLAHELEKLTIAAGSAITRAHIEQLTEATPQSKIFDLIDAALAGDTRRAAELYREQRALKVEPPQIIAMLGWQLHILLLLKTAGQRTPDQIARDAKLSPFVVRKNSTIARRLSLTRLKSLVARLADLDARSKRQTLDLDEALQNYLVEISA